MSVAVFSDAELANLWAALGGAEETGCVLAYLGIANRAAYMGSYGVDIVRGALGPAHDDAKTIAAPVLTEPRGKEAYSNAVVGRWAGNLLYNCITNGGVDYAPPDLAAWLKEKASIHIRRETV